MQATTILRKKTGDFQSLMEELMAEIVPQAFSTDNIRHMNPEQFMLLKKLCTALEIANDILVASTEIMAHTSENTERVLEILRRERETATE